MSLRQQYDKHTGQNRHTNVEAIKLSHMTMLEPASGSSWHGSKLAYSKNVSVRSPQETKPKLCFWSL